MSKPIPYGTAYTVKTPLLLSGAYLTSAPTIAAGDVTISLDGGAYGATDNTWTFANGRLNIVLSTAETEAKEISIRIHDLAGGEFEDDTIELYTIGHASAMLPNVGEPVGVHGEVDDASATTTGFVGASGLSTADDFYNGMQVVFLDGALAGVARPVVDYVGGSLTFTVSPAMPSAPADDSRFMLIGRA